MKSFMPWLINISPAEPARRQKVKTSLPVVENEKTRIKTRKFETFWG